MIVRDLSALQLQVLATILQLIFLTIAEHEYYHSGNKPI
jgi:hypothetical protein